MFLYKLCYKIVLSPLVDGIFMTNVTRTNRCRTPSSSKQASLKKQLHNSSCKINRLRPKNSPANIPGVAVLRTTKQSPAPTGAKRKLNANLEQGGDIFHPAPFYAVKRSKSTVPPAGFLRTRICPCQGPIPGGKIYWCRRRLGSRWQRCCWYVCAGILRCSHL